MRPVERCSGPRWRVIGSGRTHDKDSGRSKEPGLETASSRRLYRAEAADLTDALDGLVISSHIADQTLHGARCVGAGVFEGAAPGRRDLQPERATGRDMQRLAGRTGSAIHRH